ncbi:MAG: two-component sensor histidine kinase, partial [Rhodobiaceae bacterium]|nr:two-component sensor histidine kinase [Rhodobiaceae bacterium]
MTKRKWRPTLSMIVAAMIAVALLLPLTGVLFFRLLENQLIRNTEAELIGQSAAIAAAMSAFLEARSGAGIPLGPAIERPSLPEGERWAPTLPALDLGDAKILPERPDAKAATTAVAPAYAEVGAFLYPVLVRTQQATLAGFRVLDFNGVVIAGRSETGKSLAHVPEVEAALKGDYVSVMRSRTIEDPQPIYSISRGTKVRIFSAFPVFVGDRLAGVVYASRTPSNVVKEFYFLRGKLAVLALVVIGVAGAMVIIFARAISGPIHELSARATRIGEGDRAAIGPMVHYGSREVHRLSNELMAMSRKLFDRNDYINTFTA